MLTKSRGVLVAIQARDFERAVAFYRDVLGLPMVFRHANQWAEFKAPGLVLGIGSAGDDAVVGGGTTAICFEVEMIEKVIDELRRRGVSFVGSARETYHGREAYFADSEGNPLMLHQSPGARAEATRTPKDRGRRGAVTKTAKTSRTHKAAKPAKAAKTKAGTKAKGASGSRPTAVRTKRSAGGRASARPAARRAKKKGRR